MRRQGKLGWRGTDRTGPPLARLIAALVLGGALLAPGSAWAGPQGCVVTSPANPAFPNPCTYQAGDVGLYAATGDWRITVDRQGRTTVLSSSAGDPPAGAPVQAGDRVTAEALSAGSSVVVGNPSPLARDFAPPCRCAVRDGLSVRNESDGVRTVYKMVYPQGASPEAPLPAVILWPGYGGNRNQIPLWHPFLQRWLVNGYALLIPDPRGFGDSGGQVELDSYDHEALDVKALVSALADDPLIARQRPGDPRVGMAGNSYGGAIQWVSAARDSRIDAIAPEESWHDLVDAFLPSGVFKAGWYSQLSVGGDPEAASGTTKGETGTVNPFLRRALVEGAALGTWTAETREWFRSRGPAHVLDRIEAPTLVMQGTVDTAFPLSQAVANYAALREASPDLPVKMVWFCGGHGACPEGVSHQHFFFALRWLDRYVKGEDVDTGPPFEYVTQLRNPDGEPIWHTAGSYPVAGTELLQGGGAGTVLVNGEPASGGGADSTTPLAHQPQPGERTVKVRLPPADGTLVGAPRVRLRATVTSASGDARVPVFLRMVDLDRRRVIGNQETPVVLVADGREHELDTAIEPIAYSVGRETRIGLEVVPTSANFSAFRGAALVEIHRLHVDVPLRRPTAAPLRRHRPATR